MTIFTAHSLSLAVIHPYMPIVITSNVAIPDHEVELSAIRSQGAGGQNVNKVSSAIHLRFDIRSSSLPPEWKEKLLALSDQRISSEGVVVIKAQTHRTQEKNREDAVQRLAAMVRNATVIRKSRKPTKPTRSSQRKRLDSKTKHARTKALRGKVSD